MCSFRLVNTHGGEAQGMQFLWKEALWSLLLLPLLAGGYAMLWRLKSSSALRHTRIDLIHEARGRSRWRSRHVPGLGVLAAGAMLLLAASRPVVQDPSTSGRRILMLALDVSESMSATDAHPSRLELAQKAAKAMIEWQPEDVRIGIVAFASNAQLIVPPTLDRDRAARGIDSLQFESGSALGTGLLAALMTIFPEQYLGGHYDVFGANAPTWAYPRSNGGSDGGSMQDLPEPIDAGGGRRALVALFSDGHSMTGVPVQAAARTAAERGVRVVAIGLGTPNGAVVEKPRGEFLARFDDRSLTSIATSTGGIYVRVANAGDLSRVGGELKANAAFAPVRHELTVVLAGVGIVLLMLATSFSFVRFG